MILRRQIPAPPLAQYVEFLWYYEGWEGDHAREHVLPEGTFELVINLTAETRQLFHQTDPAQDACFRRGWISGAHSGYIIIDAVPGASMIGAHFKPGGVAPFVGSAADFRDQVVEFDCVWGTEALEARENLLAAKGPAAKFRVLEQFLLARLKRSTRDQRAQQRIAWVTDRFCREPHLRSIRAVSNDLGITHKHFIDEFRDGVGLTPKLFCRVRRFQQVLRRINSRQPIQWADLAYSCGYYDQAHFVNDFVAFSGVNPSAYLSLAEDYPNFVPVMSER